MLFDNYNPMKPHLFLDDKNHIVYFNYQDHVAYYLPENQMNKYYAFSNRFMISVLAAVLAVNTIFTLKWAIALAIILELLLGFFFYKHFLPSLRRNEKLRPEKMVPYKRNIKAEEKPAKTIAKIVLYFLLSILLVLNAWDQNMLVLKPIAFYLSIFVAIVIAVLAVMHLIQFCKK